MKDYYRILNIDKNASDKEIKSAYKALAQKHHPDKNGGDDKMFLEISEAYGVLSDKSKKMSYDKENETSNVDFNQLLRNISSMLNRSKKVNIQLDLVEGAQNKIIRVRGKKKCSSCNGIGGIKVGDCISCNGSGFSNSSNKNFSCLNCSGKGFVIGSICRSCNGKKEVDTIDEFIVKIDISKK